MKKKPQGAIKEAFETGSDVRREIILAYLQEVATGGVKRTD